MLIDKFSNYQIFKSSNQPMFPKVILKPGKERSILRRHPWIFSGAVYGVSREIHDGELVAVVDAKNQHLGSGFFSDKGSIVVRML
ncbi:hypothetical protein RZS08_58800, partial [Arthrospira platensis SPKY1]|nr:hypothetical protein [Arthrospira platensis SPKY1]